MVSHVGICQDFFYFIPKFRWWKGRNGFKSYWIFFSALRLQLQYHREIIRFWSNSDWRSKHEFGSFKTKHTERELTNFGIFLLGKINSLFCGFSSCMLICGGPCDCCCCWWWCNRPTEWCCPDCDVSPWIPWMCWICTDGCNSILIMTYKSSEKKR